MTEDQQNEVDYALLSELAGIDCWDTNLRDQPEAYAALERYRAALSAPQEAGKPACDRCDGRRLVEEGDPESGGNKVPCPVCCGQEASKAAMFCCEHPCALCNDTQKEASKVEPVAGEPFGWFYEMDRKANPKAGPVYLGGNDQKVVQTVADDEGATAFPLYLHPSQQALSDEEDRRTAALERMARLDDEMGIEP